MGLSLRETERTLRMYFVLFGLIGTVSYAAQLPDAITLGTAPPVTWLAAIYIPLLSGLVVGVAFIIAGVTLHRELRKGAHWIQTMLVASGLMMLVNGALVVSVLESDMEREHGSVLGAAIGLAITIYLHRNVRRLASEAATRDGIPAPPPVAKVV